MSTRRTIGGVLLLMALCIAGIVGMLLTEGAWNAAFFALAALPLVVGGLKGRRHASRPLGRACRSPQAPRR